MDTAEVHPLDALLLAWERWDLAPRDPHTARARMDAILAFSTHIGRGPVEVARKMSAGRRAGLSYSDILCDIRDGRL